MMLCPVSFLVLTKKTHANNNLKKRTMNKKLSLIGVGIFWCCLSFSADAQQTQCATGTGNTTAIYFVNGVHTTYQDAAYASRRIGTAYKKKFEDDYEDQRFKFSFSYNPTRGLSSDLLEVFRQKVDELEISPKISIESFFWLFLVSTKINISNLEITLRQVAELRDTITSFLTGRLPATVDVSNHTLKFQNALMRGKRVFLIPHSQGNLFANTAVSSLIATNSSYANSIGMIGVASPASRVVNNSPYVTANDDRIINGLRLAFPSTLPSNIDNDTDKRDIFNHSFLKSYFKSGLASRAKINRSVTDAMSDLDFPTGNPLGSGPITVALKWGSQPDVDLHVYEPNGKHVYYRDPGGVSGSLDLDDTDGFGPEHYFVACDTLETGSYRVDINYYSGDGAETARIQITTGDGITKTFSRSLATSIGSGGDNSPIIVATITVAKNSSGHYTYTIR